MLTPVLARDQWADEIMRTTLGFDEGITGWAASRREAVLVNQAHLDPRVRFVPGTPNDPEALISIPLIARAQIKGVLNIYRVGEEGVFTEAEFELAKRFATPQRSRSTTRRSARGSSTRRRPTRSPASSTTAASTSACSTRCRTRAVRTGPCGTRCSTSTTSSA